MHKRAFYVLVIVIVILIGLSTRMDILPLPQPVLKYGGGMLWAAMIYLILALVFVKARIRTLWLAAVLIACGIEFSQMYETEILNAFRATLAGRLTIGRGFLWSDVISYVVGVSAVALIEWRFLMREIGVQEKIEQTP